MRILMWIVGVVGLVVVLGLAYLLVALPAMQEPPDLQVAGTPEQVAEGAYLVESVMVCTTCHGQRDLSRYAQPLLAGTAGAGGQTWDHEVGFPGTMVAPNITPHHLGGWSDGEIARAITDGVSRDGRPLFPLMSYPYYRHMCQDDLERVIAYLRSMPAQAVDQPATALDFPVNLVVRTMPRPSQRPACPDPSDPVARGEYLANMAGCRTCHTPQQRGAPVQELAFAGGFRFPLHDGWGTAVSANITPHATGIGAWTEEMFVQRFRSHTAQSFAIEKGMPQTEMPWTAYVDMREEDLRAIYAYLRTVPAVENHVVPFEAAAGPGSSEADHE